jgi:hypothetical protein
MTNRFGMGSLGLGSLGNMLDSVDLVKKAWSSFNLPSSLAPTMDIDELDKRIADLKTVEQWLNVNLSMLHGTIQGMEIQRGTLAAIKAFGQAVAPNADGLAGMAAAAAAAATRAAQSGMSAAREANEQAARESAATREEAARAAENAASPDDSPDEAPPDRASAARGASGKPAGEASMAAELSRAAAAAVNPATWWNLLQNQFNQVAQSAISGAGLAVPAEPSRSEAVARPRSGKTGTASKAGSATGARKAATRKTAARKPVSRGKADR